MRFREKNDGGLELHVDAEERKLLYRALYHYSAYGGPEGYVVDEIGRICEILRVLETEELRKGAEG